MTQAAPVVQGFVAAKDMAIRLAAVDALGAVGEAHADDVLVPLLGDATSAELRLHAAIALAASGGASARDAILSRASTKAGRSTARRASWRSAVSSRAPRPSPRFDSCRSASTSRRGRRDAICLALGRSAARFTRCSRSS